MTRFVEGCDRGQSTLFPAVLDEYIGDDNPVRAIDAFVGRFRDGDILRQVFEAVVRACMDAGLVKGESFAVDASVIEANTSRYHGVPPEEADWSLPDRQTRAVKEYIAGLDLVPARRR